MSDQLGPLEEAWLEFCKHNEFSASESGAACFEAGFIAAQGSNLENNNYTKFTSLLTLDFSARLQEKTGWGKTQVMDVFRAALVMSLSKMIDNQDSV